MSAAGPPQSDRPLRGKRHAAPLGGDTSTARIDTILFDLGGVLIELAGVDQMLAWSPGVPDSSELWRRWLHSPAVRRFETGASARDAFAAEVVAEFGLPVDTGEFLDAFTYWPRALYPGATALLDELKPRFRLASVSNTNEIHWRRFGDEWALPEQFHHNFPSFDVGRLKPDADYFHHVLDALGTRAENVLFVDDNAINVEAAARLGITARRVVGPQGVRAALAELALHPGTKP
ncbi:MAG: HAD family phosphatase [Casimicrobiaceae bacterium]